MADDKSKNDARDGEGDAPGNPFEAMMSANPWAALSKESVEAMESFSRSLTEAAMRSQSALAAAAANADPVAAADVEPDPFHVAPDLVNVLSRLAADPHALAEAQMRLWSGYWNLWSSAARRMTAPDQAEPAVTPAKGDKRWRDEQWSENPMFDVIKQSYLLTSNWLVDTLASVDGLDEQSQRSVRFFARQLADAFSPTNFPLTNPDVLKAAVETRGENFVRGMKNFAEDFERGRGRPAIRQTDMDRFEVGRDVATTPGQVVYQNDLIQLIHYAPTTETQYETPLLFFPPWINKFYILDLRPENSMVRWLLDQGISVFLVSWVNPTQAHKDKTFEDYMKDGVYAALEATQKQAGVDKVNCVGYCIGGTLLSSTLAYMAKTGDDRIASTTFFAAQTDFAEAGDLLMFTTDEWLAEISRRMDANGGVLDGQTMADVFNLLRANDLIWSFYVNNYLLGKDPRPFDLLYWNADQTRLPKAIHLDYLQRFYRENQLAEGKLVIDGKTVNLGDVKIPVFLQASREDHIAPFRSVYRGAKMFGGPTTFMLAGSGHIAGVINPPVAKKYQHWTNGAAKLPDTVEAWMEGAKEHPGSWWETWRSWLVAKSGGEIPARDPEKGPLKPIEPAPGSYVKVRS